MQSGTEARETGETKRNDATGERKGEEMVRPGIDSVSNEHERGAW